MNRLIAIMVVRNEAGRYLDRALDAVAEHCDALVVVDDGSTDDTVKMCVRCPVFKKMIVQKPRSDGRTMFETNELLLRQRSWELAIHAVDRSARNWFMAIDADEVPEPSFRQKLESYMKDDRYWWFGLRFYHFWGSETFYRTDGLWAPPYGIRLVRYDPSYAYVWRNTPLHCGSLPINASSRPGVNLPLRMKHLGYANPAELRMKYERYMSLDPTGKYCPLSHYKSIIDIKPSLEHWKD